MVEDPPQRAGHRDEAAGRHLHADGVAHHVLEHVRLVEHDDVVLREEDAAAADVQPVEVGVDDDHVGDAGSAAGLLGEARLAERAAVGAGALVAADADHPPHRVGRGPVELGPVARVGGGHPCGDAGELRPPGGADALQLELARRLVVQLAQPLEADVVAAALEHRPVEARRQHRVEERQVLAGQLVLQRLGRRGHDDAGTARDGGEEVGERLAGPRAGLHDEVAARGDGLADQLGHLLLAGTLLGSRQLGRDGGQRGGVGHGTRARAASSSAASNSGQVLSVKWMAAPALCQSRKLETRSSPDVRTRTSTGGSSGR